ncbi:MAG TPA: glycoside hydrolase family 76 protein [Anaerohalosphaeraceae bacterium]|nr:glycoside hydrolase family 76 protein [Anaerohalosphaeraceae bacterium]
MKSQSIRFAVSCLLFCSAVSVGFADVLTPASFQQWGREVLTQIQNRFGRSDGLYNSVLNQTWPDYAWGQGVMFRALTAAAFLDSSYLTRARNLADTLRLRYWCTYNNTSGFNSSYGGCGDRYYDDNAWIALALIELYDLTGDSKYLTWAQQTVAFCMTGENGPSNTPNGGIRWHESDTGGASVCSTAPTILANLLLYQRTGIQSYQTDALRLYNWIMASDLRYATGIFHETNQGPLGYQTAVMTQCAVRLYQITGQAAYLKEAQRMAAAMEHVFINRTTRALTQHGKWGGHDMTNAYVELYEADGSSRWLNLVGSYLEYLYINCIDPSKGLYPAVWNDTSRVCSSDLIDSASAARAFWKMASAPGASTPHTWFAKRLVGRWQLDETAGTSAADSSGFQNHGTLMGGLSFEANSSQGPVNRALRFDGVDDYIDLPDGFANFRAGMTVSVWAYPTAVKNWARFLDFGNGEYNCNIVFGRRGSTNDLFFECYDYTASGGQVIAAGAIALNQWQMFTATLDAAGNVVLYKNGTPIASGKTALPSNITRVNTYIGRSNWAADAYYEGFLDEVRVYNYPLTAQQVQILCQTAGQAENPFPPDKADGLNDFLTLQWTPGSLAAAHDIYIGTDAAAVQSAGPDSPEYKARRTNPSFTPQLLPDTLYYWRVDEINADQTVSPGQVWSFRTAPLPVPGLLAYYKMDAASVSGTALLDASPAQAHAVLVNGPVVDASGMAAQSLAFDGMNDYVRLPNGFADLTGGLTVSFWAYPTEAGFWARFLDIGNGPANNNIVFARDSTSNTLSFEAYSGSVSGGKVTAAGAIALNQWQMFTATLDASGFVKLFKNGVEIASGQTAIPPIITRTSNYIARSNWAADAYFKGRLDDFALWNRPLSNDEVARLYAHTLTGRGLSEQTDADSPAAYWRFNETSGTEAADSSGSGRTARLFNMNSSAWTRGKHCGGVLLDGLDDFLQVSGFKGVLGPAGRTCTVWFKTEAAGRQVYLLSWGGESTGQKWLVRLDADGVPAVGVWGGYTRSSAALNDGRWHHLAAVLHNDGSADLGDIRFYVDGIPQAAQPSASVSINTSASQDVFLGAFSNAGTGAGFFAGLLDEIRIYDRALSEEQIVRLYRQHALAADLTGEGRVNLDDLSALAGEWLEETNECDLTCDGRVNLEDMSVLAAEWLGQIVF